MEEEEYCSHCSSGQDGRVIWNFERVKAILIASHTRSCAVDPYMIKIKIAASEYGGSTFFELLYSAEVLDPQARKS